MSEFAKTLKALLIVAAFLLTAMVAFASVAEEMGAVLMIWLLMSIYAAVASANEPFPEVRRGVFKFALVTAVFVTGAALANRRQRIPPIR